jgi:hypothetical protein
LGNAESGGDAFVERLQAHADIAALHALAAPQGIDDRRRLLAGIAKPMPTLPPVGEMRRCVDPDHIAVEIEHRAAELPC